MNNKLDKIFSSKEGEKIYSTAERTVRRYGMDSLLQRGVLLGLSGGADSVMLLCFLLEYRRRNYHFPIVAVHVNHMIRGAEADRDEILSSDICNSLGVEFLSIRVDVPHLAKERKISIEECARDVRYCEFNRIISGRNDISSIAVAHNLGDNAETVIYNIMRGAGTRGAAGIPPVRDNIFRPLIAVSKADIVAVLKSSGVDFAIDSTNLSIDYTRNYIRHELLPSLKRITPSPENMLLRFSENLRSDEEYISLLADEFLNLNPTVYQERLISLHRSVFVRVLSKLAKNAGTGISHSHILAIRELLLGSDFLYSLPDGYVFGCERGVCRIFLPHKESINYKFCINMGKNELYGYDSDFFLSNDKIDNSSLNVYKISIQVNLSSAIINGGLFLRPRKDGDTIYYGKMTHKLKKLLCDRKIPNSKKMRIPVLCDRSGPVWVPGFSVRDDGVKRAPLYAAIAIGKGDTLSEERMYTAEEFK